MRHHVSNKEKRVYQGQLNAIAAEKGIKRVYPPGYFLFFFLPGPKSGKHLQKRRFQGGIYLLLFFTNRDQEFSSPNSELHNIYIYIIYMTRFFFARDHNHMKIEVILCGSTFYLGNPPWPLRRPLLNF